MKIEIRGYCGNNLFQRSGYRSRSGALKAMRRAFRERLFVVRVEDGWYVYQSRSDMMRDQTGASAIAVISEKETES